MVTDQSLIEKHKQTWRNSLRNTFVTGLFVLLPAAITYVILAFLFTKLDTLLAPSVSKLLHSLSLPLKLPKTIPGVGILATIVLVFFTGLFTRNIVGRKLISIGEGILSRIPVVRSVYVSAKQFMEAISPANRENFRKVVLIEYPRKGLYSVAFITCEAPAQVQKTTELNLMTVFVPTTPNPTSGYLIMLPKESILPLDISVEDGIKFVVSGGIVMPSKVLPSEGAGGHA